MSRTSDSRTAAANDNYRNNKFWEKKNEALETENEPVKRGDDCTSGNVGQSRELGRDGGRSGTADSGDDV